MQIDSSTTPFSVCVLSYRFTGKERDTESGLDYFGARYYASNMGRWMSPDWSANPEAVPYSHLDDPQSLNLYGYVLNNPLSKPDLDGHGCPPDCPDMSNALAGDTLIGSPFEGGFSNPYVKNGTQFGVGVGLIGTVALGDVPGGAAGAVMAFNAALSGTAAAVSGVTGIVGQATKTDVAEAQSALSATSNVPGLVTTAATGNLKAGEVAATVGNVASLATAPKDAVKNPATTMDAAQTVKDTGGLVQKTVNAVKNFINPTPPPAPKPPSTPPCSVAGACH